MRAGQTSMAPAGPPDLAAFAAVTQRYALAVEPASVPRLAAEHGLALG